MFKQKVIDAGIDDRELVMTRRFDAPRALVFKAWTDPVHAIRRWGPRHYPAIMLEMDPRPGGRWRGCLKSTDDGSLKPQSGVFREVWSPERLVFTFGWDEPGGRGPETLVTIDFLEEESVTLMQFRQGRFNTAPNCEGHRFGWSSTFDRLEEILAAERA